MLYLNLFIILFPLFVGYLIPVKNKATLLFLNKLLGWMIYLILFFMGVNLAFYDNFSQNLQKISLYSVTFILCVLALNVIALSILNKKFPWKMASITEHPTSRLKLALSSLKLVFIVLLGFLLGLTHWQWLKNAHDGSEIALVVLLFLVGIQLRGSGMSIKQITLNRKGMIIAVTVAVSALIGGAISSIILGLPIKVGLSIASGFGWYSLSSIMINDAFGPVMGSTVFFTDLVRELIALIIIPSIISRQTTVGLGLCGATSMDFTLPVLQQTVGVKIVPPAIVHGFVLSLLSPCLLAFFISL